MIEKQCLVCSSPFKTPPSYAVKKFCSRKCFSVWLSKKFSKKENHPSWAGGLKKKNCAVCGRELFTKPSQDAKFCSAKCKADSQKKFQSRPCIYCGKEFTPTGQTNSRKLCSRVCLDKYSVGENNPNWKGGKSFEPYSPAFNSVFKRMVKERDNYTCAICKEYGTDVHHINYVKMDTVLTNCITLCHSCHSKTNSNRSYWQKYFENLMLNYS